MKQIIDNKLENKLAINSVTVFVFQRQTTILLMATSSS